MTTVNTPWRAAEAPSRPQEALLDRIMLIGAPGPGEGPQAHLIAQAGVLATHFHVVPEFQVFLAGSGTIGIEQVAEGWVHYVDALTPYGPVRPAPEGLTYVTLRPAHDPGACYMPASQAQLTAARLAQPGAPKRRLTADLFYPQRYGWSHLIAEPDGLTIGVLALRSGDEVEFYGVSPAGSYVVVMAGEMLTPDVGLVNAGQVRWLEQGQPVAGKVGSDGVRLAVLEFARA